MITLSYLFELARWKQEAIKGKISNKGLNTLTNASVRKPLDKYLSGFKKGTDEIRRKSGFGHDQESLSGGLLRRGSRMIPKKAVDLAEKFSATKPIAQEVNKVKNRHDYYFGRSNMHDFKENLKTHSPFFNRDKTGISDRHEAYEAREARRADDKGILKIYQPRFADQEMYHRGPQVLRSEKKDIDQLTSIYPQLKENKHIKSLINYRMQSGEYEKMNDPELIKKYKNDENLGLIASEDYRRKKGWI